MKKVIGTCIFTAHTAKEARMLNQLEKIMNPFSVQEAQRFKVTFLTKKGTFYRILDALNETAAITATGVKREQILAIERVEKDIPCTPNKPII